MWQANPINISTDHDHHSLTGMHKAKEKKSEYGDKTEDDWMILIYEFCMAEVVDKFVAQNQVINLTDRHLPLKACSVGGLYPGTGCGVFRGFQIYQQLPLHEERQKVPLKCAAQSHPREKVLWDI